MSAVLRLFVALELPEDLAQALERWTGAALGRRSPLRRIDPASMHLTLCFLGAQPSGAVAEIDAILAGLTEHTARVGDLPLGAPVWLPPRRPRALAVEVGDPEGTAAALQRALARELAAALGWEPESRRWRPHVTVARGHAGARLPLELPPTPALTLDPVALTLLHSELDAAGAHYTALARVPAR